MSAVEEQVIICSLKVKYANVYLSVSIQKLYDFGNCFVVLPWWHTSGPKVIKLFSCSAQLRLKFILLINVKMPTIVGILTFISRINYRLLSSKPSISIYLGYFRLYEQLKLQAQLS